MDTIAIIPSETIINRIYFIRDKKIMLDADLASLYHVTTKRLNEQVKRNLKRFPPDFMFQLHESEKAEVVANCDHLSKLRFSHHSPYAFTEQGVAMLSSVLNSERAIEMNIQIIRTFTKLREILADNKKLAEKLEAMERKYDKHIYQIFAAIKSLEDEKKKPVAIEPPKEPMGFVMPKK